MTLKKLNAKVYKFKLFLQSTVKVITLIYTRAYEIYKGIRPLALNIRITQT